MRVVALKPNRPDHFYRGGRMISAFRQLTDGEGEHRPEDWLASTTTMFGRQRDGLSIVGDRVLRDWVTEEPEAWLGPEQVGLFGPQLALLVKLLAPEERIPVHVHPDRTFARQYLGSRWGKTEAWVILDAGPSGGEVFIGWREPVDAHWLASEVVAKGSGVLLGLMHRTRISTGDTILVPAGVPHAIGPGMLLLELQEPADLSVLLEWQGYAIDGPRDGHLRLGYDVALRTVRTEATPASRLHELVKPASVGEPVSDRLFPPEADAFFRAERISAWDENSTAARGFAVVVVTHGPGELETELGELVEVDRGATLVVPYAAGNWRLRGRASAICCRPPSLA